MTWLLFLGLGFPDAAQAQTDKALYYQLRFSPLALVDPNTPVLQLGGQVNFKRFAFSTEFGWPFDKVARLAKEAPDSMFLDHHYYKVRAEAKYYIAWRKDNGFSRLSPYLSLEGFWVPRQFRRYNDVITRAEGDFRYRYSDISRNVLGGGFKFGLEPLVYKHWVLDAFLGMGIRRLRVRQQPVGLDRDPEPVGFFVVSYRRVDQREGVFYRPHLALGIKVGYKLN